MTRTQTLLASWIALLSLAVLVASCGDDPASDSGENASGGDPLPTEEYTASDGTSVVIRGDPPNPDEAKAEFERQRDEMNEYARGLLESFKGRCYTPARDSGLRHAAGIASVRQGDITAKFAVSFDGLKVRGEQTTVTPIGELPDDLPPKTEEQVLRFARLSFEGPYGTVVNYMPPVRLVLSPSKDGEHRVVTAPPHDVNVQVSYSVSEDDLVTIRGTSVRPAAEIAYFDWTFFRARYLLDNQSIYQSETVADYDYDDAHGPTLLERATITKGDFEFDVTFAYDKVDTGE